MSQPVYNIDIVCGYSVNACKTVGTTGAELFAGGSRMSGRRRMRVANEGSIAIYYGVGDSTITADITGTGQPIAPGDSEVFYFVPLQDIPVYFIATGSNANVKVSEM